MLVAPAARTVVVGCADSAGLRSLPELKVLRAVVVPNAVLVVHLLLRLKEATKRPFHHKPMLHDLVPLARARMVARLEDDVAVAVGSLPRDYDLTGDGRSGIASVDTPTVSLDDTPWVSSVFINGGDRPGRYRGLRAAATGTDAARRYPVLGRWRGLLRTRPMTTFEARRARPGVMCLRDNRFATPALAHSLIHRDKSIGQGGV